MKTRDELYFELCREYITPELEEQAKHDMQALSDVIIKELLADIDSCTLYWAQFE